MDREKIREKRADQLTAEELLHAHRVMVRARVTEESVISLYRRGDGFFWIGGPGEEAFNVPLGLQIDRGFGPDHDYLHFHYRQAATYLALGGDPKDLMRQMRNTATDPFSGGRNFVNHIAVRDWNWMPTTSTIGTQYSQAPGTAWVQRRHGGTGISIVTGGDAGSAEGDFATALIWSSRPQQEIPLLILMTNNEYGISTRRETQWPMRELISRAEPFGIPWKMIDGNDFFESWDALHEAIAYCRRERKPYALQANVSRLHGHSSASGAARTHDEEDAILAFEAQLIERGVAEADQLAAAWIEEREQAARDLEEVRQEPFPRPETIYENIYA
ncbi:MAG: thiamine pyrophosphate-dependent dehydrogenase E1 component subunit alpha [Deltaproteobacteria bacterium]|nr:thiamine pyrophosphate-dependent dehydrogenase E1 component subunit alpha [Deltaproteobacteria bacterium]